MRPGIAEIKRLGWFAWEWKVEIVDRAGHVSGHLGGHRRTFSACIRAVNGKGAGFRTAFEDRE